LLEQIKSQILPFFGLISGLPIAAQSEKITQSGHPALKSKIKLLEASFKTFTGHSSYNSKLQL
jgi:hypothetical protein